MAKVKLTFQQENWLRMFVVLRDHKISQEMEKIGPLWERVEYFFEEDEIDLIELIYQIYDSVLEPLWRAGYIELIADTTGEFPEVEMLEITDKARKWYEKKYTPLTEKIEKAVSEVEWKMLIKELLGFLKK